MPDSSFPTEPAEQGRGDDIRNVETMPEVPEGYALCATIELYTFKGIWKIDRLVTTQEHFKVFRLMATHPEMLRITLRIEPLIPPPPIVPDFTDFFEDDSSTD